MLAYNKSAFQICKSILVSLGTGGLTAMAVATTAVIAAGALSNLPSVLLGDIVDSIIAGQPMDGAWTVFLLLVGCLVGRISLVTLQKYLVERSAVTVQKRVLQENVSKILSVRTDALQSVRVGEATSRLEKRVVGTVRFLKLIFLEGLPQLAIAIPALVLAFTESVLAGTVMLAVLALSVVITVFQIISQRGIRIALIDKAAALAGRLAELLGHLDYVRASGMTARVKSRFDAETEAMRLIEFRHHKWMMTFDAAKGLVEETGLAVVVAVSIWQVAAGQITPGTILALAMLYKAAALPLQNLHRVTDELHESLLQLGASLSISGKPDDAGISGRSAPAVTDAALAISARQLSLTRNASDGSTKRVLSDITFDIAPGEVVGIAGPSGGGKSTLLKVMLGLFADYEGSFEMFGSQVRDLDKGALSDLIAYGPQKPYVSHGSVRANLIDGSIRTGELPDDHLRAALRRADFGVELDAELTERGDNISPGQAQRLSLARVFAKDQSKVVILDEATSMLDGKTQAAVMSELRSFANGRALIMVAHRLDTLRWADRIIVLDGGRIVQSGSFEELESCFGPFQILLGSELPQQQMLAAE
ncbi:ABC transporter ATP-binding protein [Rhizobium leguminosarum]|uniref:ABC transporter ATP-binding protein n=1 Tax=Rhizobium leguminosarum TaxID=384 RepID=UPI001C8FCC62|nr:ABC transporter ATP-binding protein [Rhizobium leguminosarum]MBY2941884.1 ABC transporter ATP-binding protein [Rhizobium leguminosarum]